MAIQDKAKIVVAAMQAGDARAQMFLMFLATVTGVSREECIRRIKVCAETGEMPE